MPLDIMALFFMLISYVLRLQKRTPALIKNECMYRCFFGFSFLPSTLMWRRQS